MSGCAASGCISGNDNCINAALLPSDPELTVRFDNRCATTDGPAQVTCDTGSQPLTGDLWYDYVAPCCGVLTVSMCNIGMDAMMAIYGGSETCECPANNSTLLGCGDDTCGPGGGPPVVSISVVKDGCYSIRAGGWNGATGSGDMTVSMACVPTLTTQSNGHFDKDPGTGAYVDAGAYADVWADGDIVYQGQILDNKVNFFDVSDPDNPVRIREWLVGFPNTGSSAEDVKVGDELLFISLFGDGFDGVEIVDVRDPANATHLSWITVPGFEDVKNSFYDNGYLYLANGTTPQLAVMDLTVYDPDAPPPTINAALWTINVGSSLVDNMTVADGRLYVAAGGAGVFVYDVTSIDSLAPQFLGSSLPQPATHSVGVSANGRWVVTTQRVLGGALQLFEVMPTDLGVDVILRQTIAPPATSTGYHNVVVDGMRVYTTLFETGLLIYEILPSGSLQHLSTYSTYYQPFVGGFSGAWGVYPFLANDRVAVSDIQTGLHIVHVANQNATFTYPDGLPDLVDPDVGTLFDAIIKASCEDLDPATASAFVRVGGETEPFVEIPLTDLGGGLFEVTLPPAACGSHVDYYLRVDTVGGRAELDPPLAPGVLYQAEVALTIETVFEDSFAADLGWTIGSFACFAGQVGDWQRVAPTPTFFAPGNDSPNDADGNCYVTGDGLPGGSPFTLDIDGGPYRLTSPVIPINGQDVRVSYDRWFFAQQRAAGISPALIVDVSEDGLFWFTVETVETAGPRWIHHEFLLSDLMTPGDSFQLRFSAADCPNKDVPEAAVDNVKVIMTGCTLVDTPLAAQAPHDTLKNRYISFEPNNPGRQVKIEVTLSASLPHPGSLGDSWWVQPPVVVQVGQFPKPLVGPDECVALLGGEATAAEIDWDAVGCQTLHVTGCAVEPTSEYDVRMVLGSFESDILTVPTGLQPGGGRWWGDTVGIFDGAEWTPPQGVSNIDDAVVAIKTFQGGQTVAPDGNVAHLSVPDVEPGDINTVVNFADVLILIKAFQGDQYPFGPADSEGNCP
ncbi:MAG: hypothetical protein IH987_05505 [Planctomycetes bacterium]|nr:hypothetical protein [Planctomycetota bacterium]